MSAAKPKAGEPSDEELMRLVLSCNGRFLAIWDGHDKLDEKFIDLARRVWRECRERTLAAASERMQELAAERGHTGSVTVAMFVEWCALVARKES
jgi:hypothetical protein